MHVTIKQLGGRHCTHLFKKKNLFLFFFLLMYCCELSLNTNNDAVFPTVICAETGRQAANQQQTGNLHLHAVKPGEKHQRGIQRDCGSV